MPLKSSNDLPGPKPKKDSERDIREAVTQDADKTEGKDRDLVHGDGSTIGLPVQPDDQNKT